MCKEHLLNASSTPHRHQSVFGEGTHPTGYPNNTDDKGEGPTTSTDEENVMIINYADGPGLNSQQV